MIPFNIAKGLRVGDPVHRLVRYDTGVVECVECVVVKPVWAGYSSLRGDPCSWAWLHLQSIARDDLYYLHSSEPVAGQHYFLGIHLPAACDSEWGAREPEMAEAYARLGAPEGDPCLG